MTKAEVIEMAQIFKGGHVSGELFGRISSSMQYCETENSNLLQ